MTGVQTCALPISCSVPLRILSRGPWPNHLPNTVSRQEGRRQAREGTRGQGCHQPGPWTRLAGKVLNVPQATLRPPRLLALQTAWPRVRRQGPPAVPGSPTRCPSSKETFPRPRLSACTTGDHVQKHSRPGQADQGGADAGRGRAQPPRTRCPCGESAALGLVLLVESATGQSLHREARLGQR